MPKYWGKQIFTHGRFPKWVKRRRKKEEEEKKKKKKKKKKKEGENNGQLCFVRHHVWRTQARLDQHKSLNLSPNLVSKIKCIKGMLKRLKTKLNH